VIAFRLRRSAMSSPEAPAYARPDLLDDEGRLVPMFRKYGHWDMDSDEAVCAALSLGVFHNVVLAQLRLRDGSDGLTIVTLPTWFYVRVPSDTQTQLLAEVKAKLGSVFERVRFA